MEKNYVKMGHKGQLSIQTIFFIMMGILMIAIIIYGFNKFFLVNNTLSEMEQVQVKGDIEKAFEHCEDPLAKGDKTTIKFKNNVFNSVCVASVKDMTYETLAKVMDQYPNMVVDYNILSDLVSDIGSVISGGDNVVLFNAKFVKQNGMDKFAGFTVVDSFKADLASEKVYCSFDFEGTGTFEMELTC